MPSEAKPLFRADALRPKLRAFLISPAVAGARSKLGNWTDLLCSKAAEKMKETELLGDFLRDVFGDLLGYTGPAAGAPVYTIKRESLVQVDGKFADAALGRFSLTDAKAEYVVVIEGKGPRDPLDRPFGSRKHSAVDQALKYAVNLKIDWYLVTNMVEFRLFHKSQDQFTYERFETKKLAEDDAALKRFAFLLGAERVVPASGDSHLDALLADSSRIGREVTAKYYHEYATLRRQTFHELRRQNPDIPPADLLTVTQKILDRILFIAFCEKRGLLPADSIASAFKHKDKYSPRPIWENFRALFRWVDEGNADPEIAKYNGGLFRQTGDPIADLLERLKVPDLVCKGFDKLAEYEYGKDADNPNAKIIDVEILGHIFEQSISDLEELHQQITVGQTFLSAETKGRQECLPHEKAGPSKRKKEGAFYTPAFVTRYIVAETLQPILAERFETLRRQHEDEAKATMKKLFANPRAYDLAELTTPQRSALAEFWQAWIDTLATIRIVDPACGSGAFLLEAFDQLHAHYQQAHDHSVELAGAKLFPDVDRQILQNNLFGMDLNAEAIEICRLSMWIKTAEKGKVLTSLDDNVKQGNSVVAEPDPAAAWRQRFPAAFAAGGFDVVLGNPPYVRQEWIARDKPFLQQHYRAYDGVADLYVYFYELGMNLLKPGGRLGFVVTNKWMRAGYGEPLRKFFGAAAWVEQVVDFGHAKQIFPDADVFPSILVARKPAHAPPPASARVCAIPRDQLRVDDLSRQIKDEGYDVPRERLGAEPWSLEPPGVAKLMEKLRIKNVPLNEFAGTRTFRGVTTGFNDAFLVDTPTKDRLVAEHPTSAALMKKYLRGQDVDRWFSEWVGEWMIFSRRGIEIDQYPAIKTHLEQYREQLEPKPKDWSGGDWRGRKPGAYKWYELQDPMDFWQEFDKPKIAYQEIQFHSCFSLDVEGMLANNKVSFVMTGDLYVLGLLNSPLMWWHNWRYLPHMKDEALAPVGYMVQQLPIAKPTDETRAAVETAVRRLIDIAAEQQTGRRNFLDWLKVEYAVEKPNQKLQNVTALAADDLAAEVKKARGKKAPAVVRRRPESAESVTRPQHRPAASPGRRSARPGTPGRRPGEYRLRPDAGGNRAHVGYRPTADADQSKALKANVPGVFVSFIRHAKCLGSEQEWIVVFPATRSFLPNLAMIASCERS